MDNIKKYINKKNKDEIEELTKLFNNSLDKILKEISTDNNLNYNKLKEKYFITGYNVFMSATDIAEQIKDEYPGINNKDLLILKSKKWKTLDVKEKEYYNLLAKNFNEQDN
jgi:methyl-accepting chemotaxis protein